MDVRPAALTGLVSRYALTPEDAARSVLSSMADLAGISDDLLNRFRSNLPDSVAELAEEADRLSQGKFRILGEEIDYSSGIQWHLDPRHRRRFDPALFHSNVVISNPAGGFDIKYPWELSRLQHLPRLALAYRLTGNRKYADALADQTSDWLAQNPVGFGPNWACTMDVAIRAANVALAFAFAGDFRWEADLAVDIVRSLIAHGRFIANNLEWSEELAGNHYLADIAGLAILSCLLSPTVFEAANWRKFARDELASEMQKQVYSDGWDFEASTAYHRLALECFLVPAICFSRSGFDMEPQYMSRLKSMSAFMRDITLPDGSFPLIGDNDSGRLIALHPGEPENLNYLISLCAAFLGEPSLKPPGRPRTAGLPEILILLGRDGMTAYEEMRPTPRPTRAEYPLGGLWCFRSDDGADLVTFRLGPVGQNGFGGHAHNDQLSVTVWFDGKPVIVDPGTACYTSDPDKRNLFRSTSRHSTVTIGGKEQNPFVEDELFRLPQTIKTEAKGVSQDEGGIIVVGAILGYGKSTEDEVRIGRKVRYDPMRRQIMIEDEIYLAENLSGLSLEWNFPIAPGLSVDPAASRCRILADDRTEIDDDRREVADIQFFPGWKVQAVETSFAPAYGVEVRNVTLRFTPPSGTRRGQFIIRAR
jgi:hypothetical protein